MASKKDSTANSLPKGIIQRADGLYRARYTYNGKRVSIYDKNLKALQKKLRDATYEMEHGIHAKPERLVLDKWYNIWLEEYKMQTVKNLTIKSYNNTYKKHIQEDLGKKKISDIRPEHIQKTLNNMLRKGYANGTIELTSIVLGDMFKQAVKNEILIKNPMTAVVIPRRQEVVKQKVLSKVEQEMFLENIKGTPQEALFVLGFSTGMRIGELTALTWEDIDFTKNTISITKSMNYNSPNSFTLNTPKTQSSLRTIPVVGNVMKLLKKHKLKQAEVKLKMGNKWEVVGEMDSLIFTNGVGHPLGNCQVKWIIKNNIKRINKMEEQKAKQEGRENFLINEFTPHVMRHSFATRALENGIPPKIVQEILGHSSITMTLDLYTHALPETKKEELKKIEYLFG